MKLRIQQAGEPDRVVTIEREEVVIGRAEDCDLVIDQPFVSKHHARISTGAVVHDLGSANGTYVDGVRLTGATVLRDGRLRLGQGTLWIEILSEELETQPAVRAPSQEAAPAQHFERGGAATRHASAQTPGSTLHSPFTTASTQDALEAENASLREALADLEMQLDLAQARLLEESTLAAPRLVQATQLPDAHEGAADFARQLEQVKADLLDRLLAEHHAQTARLIEIEAKLARMSESAGASRSTAEAPAPPASTASTASTASMAPMASAEAKQASEALGGASSGQVPEGAVVASPVSEMLFKLQLENAELRRQVREFERERGLLSPGTGLPVGAAPPPPPPPPPIAPIAAPHSSPGAGPLPGQATTYIPRPNIDPTQSDNEPSDDGPPDQGTESRGATEVRGATDVRGAADSSAAAEAPSVYVVPRSSVEAVESHVARQELPDVPQPGPVWKPAATPRSGDDSAGESGGARTDPA